MLRESWLINDTTIEYKLNVTKGVKWSNSNDLTVEEVVFHIIRCATITLQAI